MRSRYLLTYLASAFTITSFTQPVLNASNTIPSEGSVFTVSTAQNYVWEGMAGANVMYGFTQDLVEAGTRDYTFNSGSASNSFTSTDGGSDTLFWTSTSAGLELTAEKFTTLLFVYTDNSLELPLPLSYGDTWSDTFMGSADIGFGTAQRVGVINGMADGHGILQLPGQQVDDVLRVRYRKTSDISSPIINGNTTSDHYFFYNGILPYPVLRLMVDTIVVGGGEPSVERRAEWMFGPGSTGYTSIDPDDVKFIAYPNPTNGFVQLDLSKTDGVPVLLEVVARNGQVVHTESMGDTGAALRSVDVSALAKGLYQLRITNDKGVITSKPIVVQ